MDYYEIGQRIKNARKRQGWSQETLAEKINISTTHMSHIETGSTKLSLPVLVDIARTLNVGTDELLCSTDSVSDAALHEITVVLKRCDPQQARVLVDLVKAVKLSMDAHL